MRNEYFYEEEREERSERERERKREKGREKERGKEGEREREKKKREREKERVVTLDSRLLRPFDLRPSGGDWLSRCSDWLNFALKFAQPHFRH